MSKRQEKADRLRIKHPEDAKLSNAKIIKAHGTPPGKPKDK